MQPIEWDGNGVIRFKRNPIVRYLLDHGGIDLNRLAAVADREGFTKHDWDQFNQLIGYSVSGAGLSPKTRWKANIAADKYLKHFPEQPKDVTL